MLLVGAVHATSSRCHAETTGRSLRKVERQGRPKRLQKGKAGVLERSSGNVDPPVPGERPGGREKHEGVQRRPHEALVLIIHTRDKKAGRLWSVTTGRVLDPRYTSKCWKANSKTRVSLSIVEYLIWCLFTLQENN